MAQKDALTLKHIHQNDLKIHTLKALSSAETFVFLKNRGKEGKAEKRERRKNGKGKICQNILNNFPFFRLSLFSAFPSFPRFIKKQKPLRRREH